MTSAAYQKADRHGAGRRLLPVHIELPGRARFKVHALYRAEGLKRRIERRLPQLDGIRTARANVLTGTLLIQFDPAVALDSIIATIEGELADLPPAPELDDGAGSAGLVHAIADAFKSLVNGSDDGRPASSQPSASLDQPWHALDWEALFEHVGSAEEGLSSEAATERLARYGLNALPQAARRSAFSLFLEQFTSPPVLLLGVSAAVAVATGGLLEAGAIVTVVLTNAVIGWVTESQSERIVAALTSAPPRTVAVLRDRDEKAIPIPEVTVGDILLLGPGEPVPADARLLQSERLSLDESALTGESMPVEKDAGFQGERETPLGDRRNMIYRGTLISGGSGRALVVGTGPNTEIGRIQALAEGARPPVTPIERQLDELGHQLVWLGSGTCAVVFALGLIRGYGWLPMLSASISLAVAAVPEGLPMVATTTLALGVRELRRHNVLARSLDAVETLGSVQTFCFDKTGTLTLNRMTVVALQVGGERIRVESERFTRDGRALEPLDNAALRRLLEVIALCNETELNGEDGEPRLDGSATERALVQLTLSAGIDVRKLREAYPQIDLQDRAEDRPYMMTVHRRENGRLIAVKGSPEHVLELCRRYLHDGELKALDDDVREVIVRENERMAGEALRVLGVAYLEDERTQGLPDDLIWLGLTGMADPLRPGMDVLMQRFHRAGINTALITGDQSATAYAIARALDLADGNPIQILDSGKLDRTDPELLSGVTQRVQVFARVSPAHKLQIVQALQQARKVVAMTGDGVNDGPALKAADLGVAMGRGGTDVARSLADVVLEDDNLATMEAAVRHGRTIYDNVRRAIRFLLATNLTEVEVMVAGIGLGLGPPLNPMQLLWINLITDVFPGLALAMEKPRDNVMQRPPRDPDEPVIGRRDLRRLGIESAVISGGALASFGYAWLRYGPGPQSSTQTFMTLTLGQLLHALSCRSEHHTIFDHGRLPPNPYLAGALGASLAVQLLTVLVPGLRRLLGTRPVGLVDGLIIGAGALIPLLINESTKKLGKNGSKGEEGA